MDGTRNPRRGRDRGRGRCRSANSCTAATGMRSRRCRSMRSGGKRRTLRRRPCVGAGRRQCAERLRERPDRSVAGLAEGNRRPAGDAGKASDADTALRKLFEPWLAFQSASSRPAARDRTSVVVERGAVPRRERGRDDTPRWHAIETDAALATGCRQGRARCGRSGAAAGTAWPQRTATAEAHAGVVALPAPFQRPADPVPAVGGDRGAFLRHYVDAG